MNNRFILKQLKLFALNFYLAMIVDSGFALINHHKVEIESLNRALIGTDRTLQL